MVKVCRNTPLENEKLVGKGEDSYRQEIQVENLKDSWKSEHLKENCIRDGSQGEKLSKCLKTALILVLHVAKNLLKL